MGNTLRKRWWLLLWALASWLGLVLGALAVFLLYSHLGLNRYSQSENWVYLLRGLMLCGVVQGLVLGTLQSIFLWATRLTSFQTAIQWLTTTGVSMAVGMALPMTWKMLSASSPRSFNSLVATLWVILYD